jgi:hypothetical protein
MNPKLNESTRQILLRRGWVEQPDGSLNAPSKAKVRHSGLDTVRQELPQGRALVRLKPRKNKGHTEACGRFEITFHVFAMRPLDWDNCHIKELQDGLIKAGILPSDGYRALFGRVVSEKVYSEAEERTEVIISLVTNEP